MTVKSKYVTNQFWADVWCLGKPKILLLLAITCICGALMASGGNRDLLHPLVLASAVLGLCLVAGGANAINMWYDRDIDAVMKRTQNRPLPTGRMTPREVLIIGNTAIIGGTFFLYFVVNFWTAMSALAGGLFYVFIYTFLLKRNTDQNIVIGGAAGAFPPVVGWAAVQGGVLDPMPWLLFAIIFFWTPPHFWALALMTNKDYTAAKIPMLPVTKGVAHTKVAIAKYMLFLYPVTLAPVVVSPSLGWGYILGVTALNVWWSLPIYKLLKATDAKTEQALAQKTFTVSLYYLATVFAVGVGASFL